MYVGPEQRRLHVVEAVGCVAVEMQSAKRERQRPLQAPVQRLHIPSGAVDRAGVDRGDDAARIAERLVRGRERSAHDPLRPIVLMVQDQLIIEELDVMGPFDVRIVEREPWACLAEGREDRAKRGRARTDGREVRRTLILQEERPPLVQEGAAAPGVGRVAEVVDLRHFHEVSERRRRLARCIAAAQRQPSDGGDLAAGRVGRPGERGLHPV